MRLTLGWSALSTMVYRSRRRFVFFVLDVRIWRMNACPRFTRPLAVFLKRFAAPLWVLSFGIVPLQTAEIPSQDGLLGTIFKYKRKLGCRLSAVGVRPLATTVRFKIKSHFGLGAARFAILMFQ